MMRAALTLARTVLADALWRASYWQRRRRALRQLRATTPKVAP